MSDSNLSESYQVIGEGFEAMLGEVADTFDDLTKTLQSDGYQGTKPSIHDVEEQKRKVLKEMRAFVTTMKAALDAQTQK